MNQTAHRHLLFGSRFLSGPRLLFGPGWRTPSLLVALLITFAATFFRCSVPSVFQPADSRSGGDSVTVEYLLDWQPASGTEGSRTVENNLGFEIAIERGYLVTRGLQLVPCKQPGQHAAAQSTATRSLPSISWLDFGPTMAWAGHDAGAADPTALATPIIEDLLAPARTNIAREVNAERAYCKVHYLIARSTAEAEGVDGIDFSRTSLMVEGTYRSLYGNDPARHSFRLESSLANGRLFELERALSEAGDDDSRIVVTLTRDLGAMFDDVDFDQMDDRARSRTVIKSLIDSTEVTVR